MTTLDADQPEPSTRTPRVRHRGDLGDHVARTVSGLQERLLRDAAHPEAVSALARLRRGIGRGPGLDYTHWSAICRSRATCWVACPPTTARPPTPNTRCTMP